MHFQYLQAAPQDAAEEPSWEEEEGEEEEEEEKAATPSRDEQDSKKERKPTHVYAFLLVLISFLHLSRCLRSKINKAVPAFCADFTRKVHMHVCLLTS